MDGWVADYIGIPFAVGGRTRAGCDCYGLLRLVIGERLGRWLPALSDRYETFEDRERLSALVDETKPLIEAERLAGPVPYAAVVIRLLGHPVHIALVIDDAHFLHAWHGRASCVERFSSPMWEKRIEGFYRV